MGFEGQLIPGYWFFNLTHLERHIYAKDSNKSFVPPRGNVEFVSVLNCTVLLYNHFVRVFTEEEIGD